MKRKLLNRVAAACLAIAMTVSGFSISAVASDIKEITVSVGEGKRDIISQDMVLENTIDDNGICKSMVLETNNSDTNKSSNNPYYELPMKTSKKVAKTGKYKSSLTGNALTYYKKLEKNNWNKNYKVKLKPSKYLDGLTGQEIWKDVTRAYISFIRDNTKYYWLTGGYSGEVTDIDEYTYQIKEITIQCSKYNKNIMKEKSLVSAEIDKAVKYVKKNRKSSSTYNTLKAIDFYVCNHMKYGNAKKIIWYEHTLNGGLLKKYNNTGVCDSYAKITKILCDRFNIPNVLVSSYDHIWNYVKIKEKWYMIDTTWDDIGTKPSYEWFLLGKKKGIDNNYHYPNNNYAYYYDKQLDYFYYLVIPVPALSKTNYK